MTNITARKTSSQPIVTGCIVYRVEAPTVMYRVTSRMGATFRLLPYRRSGREVTAAILGGTLVGDGSAWRATGEVVK